MIPLRGFLELSPSSFSLSAYAPLSACMRAITRARWEPGWIDGCASESDRAWGGREKEGGYRVKELWRLIEHQEVFSSG